MACLGVGAGALPLFLHRRLPALAIDAVELDPAVALAAQRCFGFPPAQVPLGSDFGDLNLKLN